MVISYTIKEITDDVGYLKALGQGRTAEVQRDARIGEAKAKMESSIAEAKVSFMLPSGQFWENFWDNLEDNFEDHFRDDSRTATNMDGTLSTLIFENLKPVEKSKNHLASFEHLNCKSCIDFQN